MKKLFAAFLFFLFAAIGAMTFIGCVASTPVVQYPDNTSLALVYTYDDVANVRSAQMPQNVQMQLDQSLTARNLKLLPVDFENVRTILESIRDTDRRLNALRGFANNANYLVLTEISTEFYSPLSGRYRWDVHAKMTITDLRTHETLSQSVTLPAVLMYAHENGEDAIQAVKVDLERRLDALVDQFLKGLTTGLSPKASEAPGGASPQARQDADSDDLKKKSEAIYFVLVDRFFNAQKANDHDVDPADPAGWHGGDLEGIRQKLPYLKELGITKLWLSPIFSAASEKFFGNAAFHAYWTYDLGLIDRHFGTPDELRALALEAEKHGIGLILDLVVNHVGYGSPLVEEKPAWFHPPRTIEDWQDPVQLTEHQVHGLPDLNQDNDEVYQYIMDAAKKWLAMPNVTGYRLDAVKHVKLDFWKKFNAALVAQKPDIMLLGEYFDGDPRKVDEVHKNGRFTHLFDFPLAFALRDVFCDHKTLDYLANILPNDRIYADPQKMVTFLDNHDMPRFISTCHGDMDAMRRAIDVMMSLRGVPSLYYGSEIPLAGEKEPDNRADMTFGEAPLFQHIQNALNRRAAYPVLRDGKTGTQHFEPDFIVIARDNGTQKALILISQAEQTKSFPLPQGTWFDADTTTGVSGRIEVKPKSVSILISNDAQTPRITNDVRQLTFRFPDDGFTYALVGSSPELGQWDPAKAPRPENGTLTLNLPAQSVIAYKPVRLSRDNAVTWPDGPNRAAFTETETPIDIIW